MTLNLSNIDKYVYSNKFNHIYLYGLVNSKSVKNISEEILEFNKRNSINGIYLKPPAIILHINSPGGSLYNALSLVDTISKSSIPIITFVEGMAASAASIILLASKYRIMAPYSTVLIHQLSSGIHGKYENLSFSQKISDKLMDIIEKYYLSKTKLKKNKLKELLFRDLHLDANECLQYGFVNKILKKTKKDFHKKYFTKNPEYLLKTEILLKKTNFNNLYFYGEDNNKNENENDNYYNNRKTRGLQFVLSFDSSNKNTNSLTNIRTPKPILLHIGESDLSDFKEIYDLLPIINTVSIAKIPIYSIIKSPINEKTVLYSVLCYKRFITKNSFVSIGFHKIKDYYSQKHNNTIKNVSFMKNIIKNIFIEYTNLPKNILDNLFTKKFLFNAKECVKYGICDEII